MNQEARKAFIQARIAELIELIAQAICDGENPLMAGHVLRELEAQLAKEEQR